MGNCVQVVRTDLPFELESFNKSSVQRFALPGKLETLLVATVLPATLISVASHPNSNMTGNVLRVD